MKDNKLIAEFMGFEEHKGSYYLPLYNSGDWVTDVELEYHTSWDWLMPVIQKIGDEYLNTPFDETYSHLTEQYENIWTQEKKLISNFEDTYEAVVEFIKNQNN
jgi:predicted esterase YcpF (UPF0227 family)